MFKRNDALDNEDKTKQQQGETAEVSSSFLARENYWTANTNGLNPRQRAVLSMQQTHGNAAVARAFDRTAGPTVGLVQRDGIDWNNLPPPFWEKQEPKEVNWDVPAAGSVDNLAGGWDEKPNFPNGYQAHEATRELDAGKTIFQNDWSTLSKSWNDASHLAAQYNIQAKVPDAYVSEIGGQATTPAKSVDAPGLDNTQPTGKQDYSVGSIFKANNELDMKTPFDPNKLAGADRTKYDKAKLDATTARGDRDNAEIDVDSKLTAVGTAWSKLRQAQIKEKQAQKTEEGKDVAVQKTVTAGDKAQLEAIIKGAEGVITAGVKKDPVAGASTLGGTLTSVYYNDKLTELDAKLGLLDAQIANLQVSYEMESVIQAKNDVRTAMNEVKKSVRILDNTVNKEKQAFSDFANVVEELGKKLGLDADSLKTARTAAAALPLIEETIGHLSQIIEAIHIPSYSSQSGIGAGLVTNVPTFKTHLGQLKAYYYSVWQLRYTWIKRRDAAQSGVGMPARMPTP